MALLCRMPNADDAGTRLVTGDRCHLYGSFSASLMHWAKVEGRNVVRRWLKLGEWTGTSLSVAVPNSEFKADGIDAVAVIVQRGAADKPGIVLGAAVASLGQSRDAAVHLPVTITRTR